MQCGCPNCSQKLPVSAIVAATCPACAYDLTTTPAISVSDDSCGQWQAGIPLENVARILDVDEQIVESLVKAALLTKCDHTSRADDTLWPVEKTSLNTLLRGLKRYPVTPYHFGSPVTLWELVANGYDLVRVLQQILAGEITAVWFGGGLYALWVSRNDIHLLQM
jgi:hypothetical protein